MCAKFARQLIHRLQVLHRVSSSRLGPVDPSCRTLTGRLNFTVRRHQLDTDSLSLSAWYSCQIVVAGVIHFGEILPPKLINLREILTFELA